MIYALAVLLVLLSAADIALTVKVLGKAGRELNPIYGEKPSLLRLVVVRVIGLSALAAMLYVSTHTARVVALAIACVMYAGAVAWNLRQSRKQ